MVKTRFGKKKKAKVDQTEEERANPVDPPQVVRNEDVVEDNPNESENPIGEDAIISKKRVKRRVEKRKRGKVDQNEEEIADPMEPPPPEVVRTEDVVEDNNPEESEKPMGEEVVPKPSEEEERRKEDDDDGRGSSPTNIQETTPVTYPAPSGEDAVPKPSEEEEMLEEEDDDNGRDSSRSSRTVSDPRDPLELEVSMNKLNWISNRFR